MRLTVQKRLAGQLFNCSEKKVWIDPERLADVKEAITKQDLRDLVSDGIIVRKRTPEHSRAGARRNKLQKQKGRGKGIGSRKGKVTARLPAKISWMHKVRAQRSMIRELRATGIIARKTYSELSKKIKGGFFRSRRHIKIYLSEHRLLTIKPKEALTDAGAQDSADQKPVKSKEPKPQIKKEE
jgi:large subunit ribosomal protein L19e